jgi:hypothetical protein
MVQFTLTTPLGIPVHERDFEQAHRYLERTGVLEGVNRAAVEQVLDALERDSLLQRASGRWIPGRPDPDQFVPGDIAALRAIVADPIFRDVGAVSLQRERTVHLRANLAGGLDLVSDRERLLLQLDLNRLLDQPILASLLVDLQRAVPYFIPTDAAAAVLASRPPSQQLQQELRLPFERTVVLFGADLELDPASFPWPERFPYQELERFGVVGELLARGGHLTGLVLLADDQGHLRDDVVWMVAANPDPKLPWPASLDRVRGLVRGYRSAATLAPLVSNVAAAVAWALWRDPPPIPPELPRDFTDRQFRKAFKRNSIRVRERQGGLVGIRVLDLARNATRETPTEPEDPGPQRASPVPHMRAGHFRRVRVGPRGDFHYEPRWIAPTWVRGDLDRADQRLVIRRVPSPATWSRRDLRPDRQVDAEHPGPGDASAPQRPVDVDRALARDPPIPTRFDEDPFAPDLG